MNLIAIVGTNSARSTNRKLLKFIKTHFTEQASIKLVEIDDIPAFNEPSDRQAPTQVQILSDKILSEDGVIISTPEYDQSIPAVLKSVLEWLSYTTQPLIDKPVLITGASLGSLGSSRAQAHLKQILDAPEIKARIMPSAEFLLAHSGQAFDNEGQLTNSEKVAELETIFAEFIQFVEITNQLLAAQTKTEQAFSWK